MSDKKEKPAFLAKLKWLAIDHLEQMDYDDIEIDIEKREIQPSNGWKQYERGDVTITLKRFPGKRKQ